MSITSKFVITAEMAIRPFSFHLGKRIGGIVNPLNLEPFALYNENDGEISALTSKKNIDILIEKYHGEKVFISDKRYRRYINYVLENHATNFK